MSHRMARTCLAKHEDAGKSCRSMPRDASASRATASATSTRSHQRRRSTNSSGVWAPPPRGPSPSIVSGIVEAKWLASLAPPRADARRSGGRGSSRGAVEERRGRLLESIAGQPRSIVAVERHAADLGGTAASTERNASSRSARRSKHQLAGGGHDVDRIARADDSSARRSADRARRGRGAGDRSRGARQRQQRVATPVGRAARVRLRVQSPAPAASRRALRRTITPSSPAGSRSPASKQRQAS